jgi:hypothetical protein
MTAGSTTSMGTASTASEDYFENDEAMADESKRYQSSFYLIQKAKPLNKCL